ncbi:HCP-like protein [Backusella circina FSU 941]|nr:HCP-like protein [Backusella circina FSU 941]
MHVAYPFQQYNQAQAGPMEIDHIPIEKEVENKAKENDGISLGKIGNIYYKKKEYTKARNWFRLGAAENDAFSQFRLGWLYHNGYGVQKNYKLAMSWYQKAHINGNIAATNNVGVMYASGLGVRRNHKTALNWYFVAANKGDNCAQFNVGLRYELGIGVNTDVLYALQWYEKSAAQGNELAKDKIRLLNKLGFYIDDTQKISLCIMDLFKIEDMEEQRTKIELLGEKIQLMEQKLLKAEEREIQKDKDFESLKEYVKGLKLKPSMDLEQQEQLIPGKDRIH